MTGNLNGGPSTPHVGVVGSPEGELLKKLQLKIERLRASQKAAFGIGLVDEVKEYHEKIKTIEKEIEEIEDGKLVAARAAAARGTAADANL
jgi:hypothetical protein